tara:strand:- start:32 stop:691 length:660 start_codon:yes stop_codon:yes gene_type:complete
VIYETWCYNFGHTSSIRNRFCIFWIAGFIRSTTSKRQFSYVGRNRRERRKAKKIVKAGRAEGGTETFGDQTATGPNPTKAKSFRKSCAKTHSKIGVTSSKVETKAKGKAKTKAKTKTKTNKKNEKESVNTVSANSTKTEAKTEPSRRISKIAQRFDQTQKNRVKGRENYTQNQKTQANTNPGSLFTSESGKCTHKIGEAASCTLLAHTWRFQGCSKNED